MVYGMVYVPLLKLDIPHALGIWKFFLLLLFLAVVVFTFYFKCECCPSRTNMHSDIFHRFTFSSKNLLQSRYAGTINIDLGSPEEFLNRMLQNFFKNLRKLLFPMTNPSSHLYMICTIHQQIFILLLVMCLRYYIESDVIGRFKYSTKH